MSLRSFLSLLAICSLILMTSCSQSPIFKEHETVFRVGDQQEWASSNWNDDDWQKRLKFVPDGQVFWSRTNIEFLIERESLREYGIMLQVYGEYEVFWDGVLIGKNGNPGQEELLGPEGKLWATFSIPSHLAAKGEHLLALRTSLYHFPDHAGIDVLKIDYYDDLLADTVIKSSYMHLYAGAFLIASFYFLFLYISNKKAYSTLIFSVCCFLICALTVTVFSKDYLPFHYSIHVIRLQFINGSLLGIVFLIPYYFSKQFPFPWRKPSLTLYLIILIVIFILNQHAFNFNTVSMVLCMWIFSFGIVVHGVYKKVKGARMVLMTLLLSMGVFLLTSFVISLYAGLGLILLSMLYLLALQMKTARLAYEDSLVQSTRLKLELLKKNIQPHFLMNTLTSLMDWVEEAPKKGALFIEALAKEFDHFNQIENQKMIPITQEIALCKTHLKIMEYRKEIDYSWEEVGIEPEQKIPPAILHTLLENGITHSLPLEDNSIRFKLIFDSNTECKSYTFLTFAKIANHTTSKEDGTGLKYIKARLTESYQSKWDLISEPTDQGWKNVIKIYS